MFIKKAESDVCYETEGRAQRGILPKQKQLRKSFKSESQLFALIVYDK